MFHVFKAKSIYKITQQVLNETLELLADTTLDGDLNGGQLDAFRHAYWMALITKYHGSRTALSLGKAHEKGNYIMFKKNKKEEGSLPDYESSQMDYLNNDVGIEIGKKYHDLNDGEIKSLLIDMIKEGKLFVIKKDTKGNYLDCNNNLIKIDGKSWTTGKCITTSNYVKPSLK